MRTIQLRQRVDTDGVLRLAIPAETAGQEIDVVIVIQPLPAAVHPTWREALQKTWGSCPDLSEPADPLPEPLEEAL